MTVEEIKVKGEGAGDQFPVGMRVLAVDDDPTCLKLLETLLIRCKYHVTTTSQAITALKLLRENKDRFDLVISDVHMPDMDGFKLLELVGLEMDLPVITNESLARAVLSGNGETQAVMKGITHGACDYLLKPVRIEELRNIWQHVVRRRKFDGRSQSNLENGEDGQKSSQINHEGEQGAVDRNGKLKKKRKEQNGEEEEDSDENPRENDDPSAQKKPRVVWSVELHRKFVAAVNQLGIDKAVPKRILDLMKKYRLYLKRLSAVTSQQANIAAALGGRNPSFIHMSSLESFRNYHSLGSTRHLPSVASCQANGLLGRMNTPTAFGVHGLLPSQAVQQIARTQNIPSNHAKDLEKIQAAYPQGVHQGNLFQGFQESNKLFSAGFNGGGLANGSCGDAYANAANGSMLVQANKIPTQNGVLGNSPSFRTRVGEAAQFPDLSRSDNTWQSVVSSKYPAATLPVNDSFNHNNDLTPCSIGDSIAPMPSHIEGAVLRESPSNLEAAVNRNPVIGSDLRNPNPISSLGGSAMPISSLSEDPTTTSFDLRSMSNANPRLDHTANASTSSLSSILPNLQINDPTAQKQGFCSKQMDASLIGEANFGAPILTHDWRIDSRSSNGDQIQGKDDYASGMTKLQNGLSRSIDDIVSAMLKSDRDEFTAFVDGDMGYDLYTLST
uniref:Two-component response regulator n=1 Tax=Ananas comosus var. bracteatus TaxID=296719 RepID=A0A6V7PMP7_ANACO|nr:unnamed protein product [Ananas comosus var. bracteatus]